MHFFKIKVFTIVLQINEEVTIFFSILQENEWKTKYVNLEKTVSSVKETCVLLDKQVEHFENYSQSLTERIEILKHEKMELSVS